MHLKIQRWDWLLWVCPLLIWWLSARLFTNQELFYAINGIGQSLPLQFWIFFDFLGNAFAVFGLTLFLLLSAPRIFVAGVIGASISGILGRLAKEIFQMPRPAGALDQATFFILGKPLAALSMPSGHTLTAFAIATAYFFSASPKDRKPYLIIFVLASLTGLSRIALGAHWPVDILAGASMGLLGGVIGARLGEIIPPKWLELNSWLMYLLALVSAVGVYLLLFTEFDFPENQLLQQITAVISTITLAVLIWKMFKFRSIKNLQ